MTGGGPGATGATAGLAQVPRGQMNSLAQVVRVRRQSPAIGDAPWRRVDTGCPGVVALRYETARETLFVLTNLDEEAADASLGDMTELAYVDDVLTDQEYDPVAEDAHVRLGPYGYRWLRGRRR